MRYHFQPLLSPVKIDIITDAAKMVVKQKKDRLKGERITMFHIPADLVESMGFSQNIKTASEPQQEALFQRLLTKLTAEGCTVWEALEKIYSKEIAKWIKRYYVKLYYKQS